jgi:Spy/CpxP family protein refolding chaperone
MMRLIAITALAVFSMSCASWAQPDDEPRRRRPPPPPAERPEPPLEAFERILDEDQRAELREIFRANRERLREIEEQVREDRRELHESVFEQEVDETKLKERIDRIAKLEAERQFMRLKALARIRPSLTDEQIARLKELHERGPGMRDLRRGPEGARDYRPDPRRESGSRERDQIAPPPPREDFPDRRDRPPPPRRRPEPE